MVRPDIDLAVLALVIEEASHGYGIAERLEEVFGHLFSAPVLRGIYKALRRLEDAKLIKCVGVEPGGGGRRVRYAATLAGVRRLADAVREPRRDATMLAGVISPGVLLRVVQECERTCLEEIEAARGDLAAGAGGVVEQALRDARRTSLEAQLQWASRTRERLGAAV